MQRQHQRPHAASSTRASGCARPAIRLCLPSAASAGFTIMELMVVLLVMGIVAAAATPSFYASLQYHEIETAARRLVLDLEHVRHAARIKSQPQWLRFNGSTTYELSPGIANLKGSGAAYIVDLAQQPYNLNSVTLHLGGANQITFDGFGNASVTGTIDLEVGSQKRIVSLNHANGHIEFTKP